MAIDDNTSYELTGAQVKDLANKIKAKAADNIFVGATSAAPGSKGLVPQPQAGDDTKFLAGDGTWKTAGGGSNSVVYYATSGSSQGFPTFYTYLYSDPARTTVVTPDTILNNFENGDTILIEYESTQTGESSYKMTLAVETVAKVGADGYRMNVSEINIATGNYNAVETQFMATWDGQSSFSGRWVLVRNQMPTVNDATLTIQQNGTTVDTFTANSSTDKTVDIQTITAETVAPAEEVGAITASMIDWDTIRTGAPQSLGWSGSAGGTFTAPSLGLVTAQAAAASNATCYLAINGSTVERVQGVAAAFTWVPMTILVSKGDVVRGTTSDNGGNAQFVPSGCFFIPLGA